MAEALEEAACWLAAVVPSWLEGLPASCLVGLPASWLEGLPASCLVGLPASWLEGLPASCLVGLPAPWLEGLPASWLGNMDCKARNGLVGGKPEPRDSCRDVFREGCCCFSFTPCQA